MVKLRDVYKAIKRSWEYCDLVPPFLCDHLQSCEKAGNVFIAISHSFDMRLSTDYRRNEKNTARAVSPQACHVYSID